MSKIKWNIEETKDIISRLNTNPGTVVIGSPGDSKHFYIKNGVNVDFDEEDNKE